MPRPRRLDPTNGWHHVMSRGVNKGTIFFSESDRLMFGQLLSDIHHRFGVEIHAYCLMGNHFHLLLRCPESGLSDAMQRLLSVFAQRVNARIDRVGHLFGGRFLSRWLTEFGYIANVVRYIHRNPLDIHGIDDPADYRWSSHRHYLRLRPRPEWLFTDTIETWFDGPAAFDAFVTDHRRSRQHAAAGSRIDPKDLLRGLDVLLAERSDASPRHRPAQRRAVALELMSLLSEPEQRALIDHLGLAASADALRTAVRRSQRLMQDERGLREIADLTLALFDLDDRISRAA